MFGGEGRDGRIEGKEKESKAYSEGGLESGSREGRGSSGGIYLMHHCPV